MNKLGGYKIIDFGNKNFDTTDTGIIEVPGVYDAIESNYQKVILFSGIVIDGVERNDVFCEVTVEGDDFTFIGYGYKFTIDDTDNVAITPYVYVSPATTEKTGVVKMADFEYELPTLDSLNLLGTLTDLFGYLEVFIAALRDAGIVTPSLNQKKHN